MVCISLAERDVTKCIQTLQDIELAEIRLDLVGYSLEDVQNVFSLDRKLVATCRPDKYEADLQLEYLKTAIEAGASYVDIEYEASESYRLELIKSAREKGCDVIISYHNFETTPSSLKLNKIIDEMVEMGADVAKIATMINNMRDVANIFSLYSRKNRLVALGMGEQGKITRLLAPILGAEFTFATLANGEETAPGQLTRDQLLEAIELIKKL